MLVLEALEVFAVLDLLDLVEGAALGGPSLVLRYVRSAARALPADVGRRGVFWYSHASIE